MKKSLLIAVAMAASFIAVPSTGSAAAEKTIVGVAAEAGQFKTLVAAVKAAGLVDTLNGAGPFTVFAPTDEAFAKLPAGTVEDLLKPENKEKLQAVLTYHVVPGKIMAADVKTSNVKTVNGKDAAVKAAGGNVTVGGAKVVKADIAASNGVIHVIDTVLIP
jgi:uncharacterized surface protein with fasciclin (FAS1) repeats